MNKEEPRTIYHLKPCSGLKNKLFVSYNGPKKNRVGRSVKKKICIIFLVKNVCFMHVLR